MTFDTANDLDPRICVEPGGTVHVVWWTDGAPSRVFLRTKSAAASLWDGPTGVISGARRASVAVLDGVLHVSQSRPWVDWKQDGQVFGFAANEQSGWGAAGGLSWLERS